MRRTALALILLVLGMLMIPWQPVPGMLLMVLGRAFFTPRLVDRFIDTLVLVGVLGAVAAYADFAMARLL